MDSITNERRQELEKMLGCKICPLTIEEKTVVTAGLFENSEMPLTVYGCAVDTGTARGGKQSQTVDSRALTPCSAEYSGTCDLYLQAHRVVMHNGGKPIELNSGTEYAFVVREPHRGPGFGTTPVETNVNYRGTFVRAIGDMLYFSTAGQNRKPNLEFRRDSIQNVSNV